MRAFKTELKRKLVAILSNIDLPNGFSNPKLVSNGNLVLEGKGDMNDLITSLEKQNVEGIALITLVDDSTFVSEDFSNWLWVTFTRSNPANDMHGLNSQIINN